MIVSRSKSDVELVRDLCDFLIFQGRKATLNYSRNRLQFNKLSNVDRATKSSSNSKLNFCDAFNPRPFFNHQLIT